MKLYWKIKCVHSHQILRTIDLIETSMDKKRQNVCVNGATLTCILSIFSYCRLYPYPNLFVVSNLEIAGRTVSGPTAAGNNLNGDHFPSCFGAAISLAIKEPITSKDTCDFISPQFLQPE